MKVFCFRPLVGAVLCGATMATSALAQSAPEGSCQIFVDVDYGGAGGNIVGTENSGDVVMFTTEAEAPADMVQFLSGTVGYRVFYDPSWNQRISSVKVGQGCTLELHNSLVMNQGSTMPFASYTSDTAFIGDAENDKAQMAICRCAQ